MQKILPCLWFNHQASQAVEFYTSIFKNSKVGAITHYGDNGPFPKGSVMTINFQIDGQEFMALNGGPYFTFSPAISLYVNCEDQQEIDQLWQKLSEGGEKGDCGWLTDQFGISWQIVPAALAGMLQDRDPERSNRVLNEILQMNKLDIERLSQVYQQK